MRFLILTDTHFGYSYNTKSLFIKFFKRIKDLDFDAVIHCGDISSHEQNGIHSFLKLLREYIPNKPIMIVRGNHDYYDFSSFNPDKIKQHEHKRKYYKFCDMDDDFKLKLETYNITHLHNNPQIFGDIIIAGYDSWYINGIPSNSNDVNFMPKLANGVSIDKYLLDQAYEGLNNALNSISIGKTGIMVAHHNFRTDAYSRNENWCQNPRYFDFIASSGFKYYLYGHTHVEADFEAQNVRCINVGSDYDIIKYKILDV